MENQQKHDFGNHSFLASTAKAILSFNLGTLIRTVLGGSKEGLKSLERTYEAVSPFEPIKHGKGQRLLERLPEVTLDSLAPVPERLTLDLRYVDIYGATPYRDVLAIVALAIAQNPAAALEFGTYLGSTTANLALNLPNALIHTLDLPEEGVDALIDSQPVDDLHLIQGRSLGKCFRGTPLASRIVQHTGDTATYEYSSIQDDVTFFLIDGSHTYEYAKGDTLRSFAVGRGMCTFVWHDCDPYHPGVTSWLGEMIGAGLPVVRICNTSVAAMKADTADAKIRSFLSA